MTLEGSLFKLEQTAKPQKIQENALKEAAVSGFLFPLLLMSKYIYIRRILKTLAGIKTLPACEPPHELVLSSLKPHARFKVSSCAIRPVCGSILWVDVITA